jgi:hypothetical protein
MEPVAGFGLRPRFSYEENSGFPSGHQELFGLTPSLPFQYAFTIFTDSRRLTSECMRRLQDHYPCTILLNSPTARLRLAVRFMHGCGRVKNIRTPSSEVKRAEPESAQSISRVLREEIAEPPDVANREPDADDLAERGPDLADHESPPDELQAFPPEDVPAETDAPPAGQAAPSVTPGEPLAAGLDSLPPNSAETNSETRTDSGTQGTLKYTGWLNLAPSVVPPWFHRPCGTSL